MTTAVTKKNDDSAVAFVPFMGKDAITLSAEMVRGFIASPTKSGKLPTDRDCVKFVMLCKARRLNPFEGDAFMIGFDDKDGPKFTIVTAHQAFLKRAEVNEEYNGMESGVIVENDGQLVDRVGDFTLDADKVVGGWARVHFKNRAHAMEKRVKLSTFNKGFGRWNIDPAGMIVKCAEADALRSAFPTMLGGMYVEQEMGTITVDVAERAPVAMPIALTETTPATPDPVQQENAPRNDQDEPHQQERQQAEGELTVVGQVEQVSKKSGKSAKGEWTRYGVKVNGEFYNTFDGNHGTLAEDAKAHGYEVEIAYTVNEKGFKDITNIAEKS